MFLGLCSLVCSHFSNAGSVSSSTNRLQVLFILRACLWLCCDNPITSVIWDTRLLLCVCVFRFINENNCSASGNLHCSQKALGRWCVFLCFWPDSTKLDWNETVALRLKCWLPALRLFEVVDIHIGVKCSPSFYISPSIFSLNTQTRQPMGFLGPTSGIILTGHISHLTLIHLSMWLNCWRQKLAERSKKWRYRVSADVSEL